MSFVERAYTLIRPLYRSMPNHGVYLHWLVGLLSVENSTLGPSRHRFEPHVYKAVLLAKRGVRPKSFPGFLDNGQLRTFIQSTHNDTDLRALATSWGVGQIMGYHFLQKWNVRPSSLPGMSLKDSVRYTILLMAEGLKYLKASRIRNGRSISSYEQLLRWWNTGSTTGTTYSSHYCSNAMQMALTFKAYEEKRTMEEELKDVTPEDVVETAAAEEAEVLEEGGESEGGESEGGESEGGESEGGESEGGESEGGESEGGDGAVDETGVDDAG